MTRWEALLRYDPEIREAASKLMPFGSIWIDRLGDAFCALNEDRKYLDNIVNELVKEAEHVAVIEWLHAFSKTKEGEATSEEALRVLATAQTVGYQIKRDTDGTFLVTRSSSTTYLRSNGDILRFAKFALRKSASE